MSDVVSNNNTSTAPSINKQLIRASILVAILSACVITTKRNNVDNNNNDDNNLIILSSYRHELTLLHLVSFASWFGCSVWVSFVAGIIMFKNLPRHVFGRLQSKLFPAYFWFSAILIVIATVTANGLGWPVHALYMILATILTNLVYFEPQTTKVMFQRHAVERKLGTGHEVGQLKPSDPSKANDPQLKKLSKQFGMLHGLSTLMNLAALCVGCYWLNFCTQQMLLSK